jgi:hypothetical protein
MFQVRWACDGVPVTASPDGGATGADGAEPSAIRPDGGVDATVDGTVGAGVDGDAGADGEGDVVADAGADVGAAVDCWGGADPPGLVLLAEPVGGTEIATVVVVSTSQPGGFDAPCLGATGSSMYDRNARPVTR